MLEQIHKKMEMLGVCNMTKYNFFIKKCVQYNKKLLFAHKIYY
ncbi:hypothetical protein NitYY0814_P31 (plasmid) [Nitratiruptor sp. YY08-14]|nr:hypothetical protein NitYY0810_P31 [Nitratiruptor sp. YY08-10]BCD65100.1 hypothetical protein NitYY0814_P31 [Nitratiruptor sp. YY08-14]